MIQYAGGDHWYEVGPRNLIFGKSYLDTIHKPQQLRHGRSRSSHAIVILQLYCMYPKGSAAERCDT
jgi:hypothetical protein